MRTLIFPYQSLSAYLESNIPIEFDSAEGGHNTVDIKVCLRFNGDQLKISKDA
jgi:hypothetical protein